MCSRFLVTKQIFFIFFVFVETKKELYCGVTDLRIDCCTCIVVEGEIAASFLMGCTKLSVLSNMMYEMWPM